LHRQKPNVLKRAVVFALLLTVGGYGLCRKYLPLPEKPYVAYFTHILKTRSKPCGMGNYLMLCAGHHFHLNPPRQLNSLQ